MRLIKSLILMLALIATSSFGLAAQTRVVSGNVSDSGNEPMVGVTVMVAGTNTGGMTDLDGNYSLNVPKGTVTLKFSFVGYSPETVKVTPNMTTVNVVMKEDAIALEEAVVVGYGVQKKVNVTGAVATIDSKDLENRTAHSVTNMLQGAIAGLNITTSSSVPGKTPTINVRGTTSINTTSPLVLIDGVEGDLNRVNPNDVAQLSVIKDASAAAVYGARAAFGVILVTTKSGTAKDGKATVRYSGRIGWEAPTTSTDYENTGYWSVYTVNKFWYAKNGKNYVKYTDYDMQQLLARVNDKTEHPDRPWVVEDYRNGRNQWVYYGNHDWWDELYTNKRPVQQHNISLSGGSGDIKYFVSGGLDYQKGMTRANPDIYRKYNLRAKVEFPINKWAKFSNNASFFGSQYTYQGDGSIENTIAYSARHAIACFPMQNPDGSYLYGTPYLDYKIGNGRHIILLQGLHPNTDRNFDFANTSRLVISPIKQLSITADFTYRFYQARNTSRSNEIPYREYPDQDMQWYSTGAGQNDLKETANTRQYYSVNAYATYTNSWNKAHNVTVTAGYNYETMRYKNFSAYGRNLSSTTLDDLNLVGPNSAGETYTEVSGGQAGYALSGIFGRINYDYKGRYLFEVSGRYDGSSRFAAENRWGWFPSASAGWRISEEEFFQPAQRVVNNLKLRLSYGALGNQNVSSYYTYMRLVSVKDFGAYSFGEGGSMAKYSSLGDPVASDLTWETAKQWDLGLDFGMFNNRLTFTGDLYVRNTINMLTDGVQLPGVYGADVPKMNAADLRTKGYEVAVSWRDNFSLFGHQFDYSVGFNLSDYTSEITKYDNRDKSFAKDYYEGMKLGEIWGFVADKLFETDEEAQAYAKTIDLSYRNPGSNDKLWHAGYLRYRDLDGDNKLGIGSNTVNDPGDRRVLGNSLAHLQYGINASIRYFGFDASVFFQGTGNHYWYPAGQSMPFWGPFSYTYTSFMPKNFLDNCWAPDNTDAYYPAPLGYASTGGYLAITNSYYLQNIRYLRLKNLTIGYTIPKNITKKAYIDMVRVYFTGENLTYWSPIKKHNKYIDPEGSINRYSDKTDFLDNAFYPWQKSYMFGLDITF